MKTWLQLPAERKRQILSQANQATSLPVNAIEKDWWVTLSLQALFSGPWKDHLVFKGGTSLSKAWNVIERFSEDVDVAMDHQVLGFPEEFVSNTQLAKLRKKSSAFIANEFCQSLVKTLHNAGVPPDQFRITVPNADVQD